MPVAVAVRRRFRRAYKGVQTLLVIAEDHGDGKVGTEEIYDNTYTAEGELGSRIQVWDAQDYSRMNDSQATLTALPLQLVAKIHPNPDDLLNVYDSESDWDSLPEDASDCSSVCTSFTATDSSSCSTVSTVSRRASFDTSYQCSESEFSNDPLEGVKLNQLRRVGQDENGGLYTTVLSPPPKRARRDPVMDFA